MWRINVRLKGIENKVVRIAESDNLPWVEEIACKLLETGYVIQLGVTEVEKPEEVETWKGQKTEELNHAPSAAPGVL